MYIDDFIWLPDFIEKLIVKHHVTPDEAEEIFSTAHGTVLSNQVIWKSVKMEM